MRLLPHLWIGSIFQIAAILAVSLPITISGPRGLLLPVRFGCPSVDPAVHLIPLCFADQPLGVEGIVEVLQPQPIDHILFRFVFGFRCVTHGDNSLSCAEAVFRIVGVPSIGSLSIIAGFRRSIPTVRNSDSREVGPCPKSG